MWRSVLLSLMFQSARKLHVACAPWCRDDNSWFRASSGGGSVSNKEGPDWTLNQINMIINYFNILITVHSSKEICKKGWSPGWPSEWLRLAQARPRQPYRQNWWHHAWHRDPETSASTPYDSTTAVEVRAEEGWVRFSWCSNVSWTFLTQKRSFPLSFFFEKSFPLSLL
jgi:hypothetical protein